MWKTSFLAHTTQQTDQPLCVGHSLPFLPPCPSPPSMVSVLRKATNFYFPLLRSLLISFCPLYDVFCYYIIISGSLMTIVSLWPFLSGPSPFCAWAGGCWPSGLLSAFRSRAHLGDVSPKHSFGYYLISPHSSEKPWCPPDIPWWVASHGQQARSFHTSPQLPVSLCFLLFRLVALVS